MLRIRLQRVGRKHEPTFRVVLTDSKNSTKSGKLQEILGNYDPRVNKPVFNVERIHHWISVGAKPTDTLHNLLVTAKVIEGKKINVLPRKSPIKKEGEKISENAPTSSQGLEVPTDVSKVEEAPVAENPADSPKEEVPTTA